MGHVLTCSAGSEGGSPGQQEVQDGMSPEHGREPPACKAASSID